jgi:hypothetical protein
MPPECDIQKVSRSSNIHTWFLVKNKENRLDYEIISFVNSYVIITMTKKLIFQYYYKTLVERQRETWLICTGWNKSAITTTKQCIMKVQIIACTFSTRNADVNWLLKLLCCLIVFFYKSKHEFMLLARKMISKLTTDFVSIPFGENCPLSIRTPVQKALSWYQVPVDMTPAQNHNLAFRAAIAQSRSSI